MGPNRQMIYNLFSQTNEELHAREKRPIAKFYSVNGISPLEPLVDTVVRQLCDQLDDRFVKGANAGKTCNLGDWLLYCKITYT